MRPKPLILIVEDTVSSREIMEIRLCSSGYDVITAVDGIDGLEMAKKHLPDLILLDILMPRMDGLEVCRHLKADNNLPFMPIIMVTAKTDSKDIVEGLDSGGDDYLAKPIDHTALIARVKSMLRIKELHDTVQRQAETLKRQLKTASRVQSLFWPEIPKLAGDAHIWAASSPAGYVGGDLYDIIQLKDNSLIAYVADVSDKGVPAALIMAALSTTLRKEAGATRGIDELLKKTNDHLYNLTKEEGYFATVILVRFWPESGTINMIRAGHPHPVWLSNVEEKSMPKLPGIALGVSKDATFVPSEITLSRGESLLLYSDGVIEAENDNQEQFGEQRLKEILASSSGPPFGENLSLHVQKWEEATDQNDDLTILEIWRS